MIEKAPIIVLGGLVAIVWLYMAARVISRAITRTLEERKKGTNDGKAKEQKEKSIT